MENYKESLLDPALSLRPHPFWQWNSDVPKDSMSRAFQQMKNAGLGGCVISFDNTDLSDSIGEIIISCAAESEKHGFETIFRQSSKEFSPLGEFLYTSSEPGNIPDENILAVFAKNSDGSYIPCTKEDDGALIAVCRGKSDGMILDKKAAKEYFSLRLAPMSENTPAGTVNRVCVTVPFEKNIIPWCEGFEKEYKNIFGYDIIPSLMSLFENCGNYTEIRADFHRLAEKMYCDAMHHALKETEKEYGCIYVCGKPEPDFPVLAYDAADAPIIDVPFGTDTLCVVKAVSSFAAQLGKKRVTAKCFEGMGWDISFEKLKHSSEPYISDGASLISPAFQSHSLKGDCKRKNAGSLYTHQPLWEHYRLFNDYISRISQMMSGGTDTADTLLLSPRKGLSALISPSTKKQYYTSFSNICDILGKLHLDYHIGDEAVLEVCGKTENGILYVGESEYSAVFIPKTVMLSEKTAKLLTDFAENGGKLVALAPIPTIFDGKEDEETARTLTKLSVRAATDYESLITYLEREKLCDVRITCPEGNAEEIRYRCRKYGDRNVYFFVNTENTPCNAAIYIKGYDSAVRLRAEDLSEIRLPLIDYPAGVAFNLRFEPGQSYIIITAPSGTLSEGEKTSKPATVVHPKPEWEIEECEHNALTLDMCALKTDKDFSAPCHHLAVSDQLAKIPQGSRYELKYEFEIDENFSLQGCEDLRLAMENTSEYEIYINEKRVFYNGFSVWRDSAFEVIDIKNFVTKGKNTVTLKSLSDGNDNAECIYIVGKFGVFSRTSYVRTQRRAVCTDGPFFISNPVSSLPEGKLCDCGYPFFSGKMKLSQTLKIKKNYGERIYLDLDMPYASFTDIRINNGTAIPLMWKDGEVDITEHVKRVKNKLTLEISVPCRNLLGPHHHPQGEPVFTDESAFNYYDSKALWKERYCFTDAGI